MFVRGWTRALMAADSQHTVPAAEEPSASPAPEQPEQADGPDAAEQELLDRIYRLDLHPDDLLTLSDGLVVAEGALLDTATGRVMAANGVGKMCVDALSQGASYEDIREEISEQFPDVEEERVRRDVLAFLVTLDRQAYLRVHKNWKARLRWRALLERGRRYLALDWPLQPARRHPSTLRGLMAASLRVSRVALFAALVLSVGLALVVSAGPPWIPGSGLPPVYAGWPLMFGLAQVLLLWTHELGHMLVLRRVGVRDQYLATRGLSIGIAHAGLGTSASRLVAVAGPGAVIVVAGLLALVSVAIGASGTALFLLACALLHAYSLVPWASDGRMLWSGRNRGMP